MKQIDKYVNSVYQNANGDKKAIEELKLEMKSHLLEAVNELKESGRSEQESIDIAIERFGEEKEIRSMLSQLFKAQKVFAKWVLYVGIVILLLSSAVFGYFLNIGNKQVSEYSDTAYAIDDIMESDENLETRDEKVKKLIEDKSYIKEVSVYMGDDKIYPVYELKQNNGPIFSLFINEFSFGTDKSTVNIGLIDNRDISFLSLFFGLTCFGVLFFIWAIINVYHKRKIHQAI